MIRIENKKGGNRFSSFGLDTKKKSKDRGTTGNRWCPWSDLPPDHNGFIGHNVEVGMSMCFAHFVICLDCAINSLDLKNLHKWTTNDCFKCKAKDLSCYHIRTITYPNDDIAICRECIDLAIKLLNNHAECQNNN